jgi:hypothetical protein
VLHWLGRGIAFLFSVPSINTKRTVTIGSVGEQIGLTGRNPTQVHHPITHISLNQLEKEIKL